MEPVISEPVAIPAPSKGRAWLWPALCAALAVIGLAGWIVALRGSTASKERLELAGFWQRALHNGKPTRLVIPTPIFLVWPGQSIRARDVQINDFSQIETSRDLKPLVEKHGTPDLSQSYSVLAHSLAAVSLAHYLAVRGNPVGIAPESQLALDSFTNENLVFFGFPHTSRWINNLLSACNFHLDAGGIRLINRHPMPGEPADFRARDLSPTRHVRPHLLALLPGKERGTNLLLLGGQYASATPFLTSPSGVDAIEEMWRKHNRPAHFEAVIMAETEGETVVKAHIVAFRAAAVND